MIELRSYQKKNIEGTLRLIRHPGDACLFRGRVDDALDPDAGVKTGLGAAMTAHVKTLLETKPRRAASCRREWIGERCACSYSAR
jgi:hypothetical protein